MVRAVLLRHELPGGAWHYDWMIQRLGVPGEAGRGELVTWRAMTRLDEEEITTFDAVRIADHRPEYLEYEGPVSGGRGSVRRVAAGRAVWRALSEEHAEVVIRWDVGWSCRYVGRMIGRAVGSDAPSPVWRFDVSPGSLEG